MAKHNENRNRSIRTVIMIIIVSSLIYINIYSIYNQNQTIELKLNINDSRTTLIKRKQNDLSFIIATRNDNYGINPILRLRLTLQNLLLFEWRKLWNVSIEIIVIEWNPVAINPHVWENKHIKQLLDYKDDSSHIYDTEIVFYSIPSEYNDKANCLLDRPNLYCPFYEYHAKNVGIRRSNGRWKIVMNMDDLYSITLLNLLGHHLKYNLFDQNAVYQAHSNRIRITNDSYMQYLNNIQLIYINGNISFDNYNYGRCIRDLNGSYDLPVVGALRPSSGDFVMIHNDILYNYYPGGYLETCGNIHLDSEFVIRHIYVNNLKPLFINARCSYYHIEHDKQREHRNDNRTFISFNELNKNNTKAKVECNQKKSDIYQYTKRTKQINNSTYYRYVYNNTHYNWGIKNVNFNMSLFCGKQKCQQYQI
eukprot:347963_1